MRNALSVSEARSKLGRLADQAVKGKSVYLKRGRVTAQEPILFRPFGYFKFDDKLTALAVRAEPSFAI
jgi:hypothetical protein